MITYYSDTFNQNFSKMQTFYNECLEDLNIASLECPCHHKGHLIKHGFYTRKIKTPDGIIPLKIQRFKCKHCHHTHAFLLSVIIPYSQILFHDTLSIIRSNSMQTPPSACSSAVCSSVGSGWALTRAICSSGCTVVKNISSIDSWKKLFIHPGHLIIYRSE